MIYKYLNEWTRQKLLRDQTHRESQLQQDINRSNPLYIYSERRA